MTDNIEQIVNGDTEWPEKLNGIIKNSNASLKSIPTNYITANDVNLGTAYSSNTGQFFETEDYNSFFLPVKSPCIVYIPNTITLSSYSSIHDTNTDTFLGAIQATPNALAGVFRMYEITDSDCVGVSITLPASTPYIDMLAFSSNSVLDPYITLSKSIFNAEGGSSTLSLKTKEEARLSVNAQLRVRGAIVVRFEEGELVVEAYKRIASQSVIESDWLNDANWLTLIHGENTFQSQIDALASVVASMSGSSEYADFKVNFLGDSITWYGFEEIYGTGWCLKLMDLLGIPRENAWSYGVGGNRLCVNQSGIETEAAGGSVPIPTGYFHATTNTAMVVRYAEMRDDADIIIVLAGTNDTGVNPAGTSTDTVLTTIYGAQKALIEGLAEKYKGKTVVYCTLLHKAISDTENTLISNAIKETCTEYGVQYLDLRDFTGIGKTNIGISEDLSNTVIWTIDGKGMDSDGTEMAVADAWMGNPALTNYIPITALKSYHWSIQQYYSFYDSAFNPLIVRTTKQSLIFDTPIAPENAEYLRIMSINTSGVLPTGMLLGVADGVTILDGVHPSQFGHDKIAEYSNVEIRKFIKVQ